MQVLHVNRSPVRTVSIGGKEVPTGIYKEPVRGPVAVGALGLEGDGQADPTVHGGPYQALYVYPSEHYARWERELDAGPLPPGTFGENLTTAGLLESEVRIGDIFRMGEIEVQVTSARIPCFKFGHKVGRPEILKPFLQSGLSGFYLSVLREGTIAAGTAVELVARDPREVTVRDLLGMHRLGEGSRESLGRALATEALAPLVRRELEARLAKW